MKCVVTVCTILGLIVGCKAPTHEQPFLRHTAAVAPVTKNVPFNGQYRLYANPARFPTTQSATPLFEARLAKGELLGFELTENGNLLAVVRTERKPLTDSSGAYTWTLQADPGQFDANRTVGLVVLIVFVAGIGIGITAVATNPWN